MASNQEYTSTNLTVDMITKIKNGLTKDYYLILKTIHDAPDIQHKDLCDKINKTPNNLSNMINKINKVDSQLIQTKKSGTKKYYSLTSRAVQFVEQILLSEEPFSKNHEYIHLKSAEAMMNKVEKTINSLKEKCGSNLQSILNSLLNGQIGDATPEVQELYNDLLSILCDCKKQDSDTLQQILNVLENELLADQITKYLDKKFFYFDLFKPLLTSGKIDNTVQFQIIDRVFSELHPLIFSPYQDGAPEKTLLSSTEWNNLLLGIINLSNEYIDKHYSKSKAVENWDKYFLSKELSFYIAEKCSLLIFLGRLIPNSTN